MKCLPNGVEAQGAGNAVASQTNLAITIFENDTFGKIRTSGTADEPLFCLADIGRVLEMTNVNACKSKLKQEGIKEIYTLTEGGVQSLAYISEQNLYKLIMRSNKPQAEPFQDWVCGEVLPQIRKTGGYIPVSAEDDEKTILAKAVLIGQRTMEQQKKIIAKQKGIIDDQKCEIGKLAPKAAVYDRIALSEGTYTATQLAKEFGYESAQAFYKKLMDSRILYKQSDTYMPYKDWANRGLFTYRTRSIKHSDGTVEFKTYLVFCEKFRMMILRSRYRRALNNL